MAGMFKEAEHAAQTLGIQLQLVPATSPEDIAGAFSLMTRERADALSVFPSPILFAEYGRIANIAAEKGLPTIYAAREGRAGFRSVALRSIPRRLDHSRSRSYSGRDLGVTWESHGTTLGRLCARID
jgi:hypothetical protein